MQGGDEAGFGDESRREAIRDEFNRLEESAKCSSQGQFEQAKQWRSVNLGLGAPTSLLAAISGATVLSDTGYAVLGGIFALMAAAGGAILTTLNASHRMNQAAAAANAYLEIQTAARQARLIDLPGQDLGESRAVLAELTARRDEQNKTAEIINRRAWKKAQSNINDGGQDYAVDGSSGQSDTER
ncbi:SLATT domain-containing protein [Rhodococcus sp. ACT016]|uniref:SLATT domain-containing protein n=1 Tax=Rhodococcus sp. ACT016 TaxID=3134808 RepID=UPI003D2CD300